MRQKSQFIPPLKEWVFLGKSVIKKVGLWDFENAIRSVIDAIYLQVREVIGNNIEMMLSQQIDDGFRKLYHPKLRKRIEERFNLLEFKKEKE